MTGEKLYDHYCSFQDEYSQLLAFLFDNMREDLFPLLEKAEAGKTRLSYDDSKVPDGIIDGFDPEFVVIL